MRRISIALLLLSMFLLTRDVTVSAQDVFARARAVYTALKSYSDTGTVLFEFGPAASLSTERHVFRTYYRAPRHYFFDFTEDKKAGGERHVIWSDDESFHAWHSLIGVETTYPKGQGGGAFAVASVGTAGSIMKIAPLLFPRADLAGTLTEAAELVDAGFEIVGGRRCHKLTGVAKSVYAKTGHETNVRRITIWIDAETMLVRKVFEDTPKGGIAGNVLRYTTTFEPVANPHLDDSKFRFVVPLSQR